MAHRASGLNLVVNAIILRNTVYLCRAVDYIRSQGIIIPDELFVQRITATMGPYLANWR